MVNPIYYDIILYYIIHARMQQCNICSSNPNNKLYNYQVFAPEPNSSHAMHNAREGVLLEGLSVSDDYTPELNVLNHSTRYLTCDIRNKTLCANLKDTYVAKEEAIPGIKAAYNDSWTNYHTCNNKKLLCNNIIPTSQQLIQGNINTNTDNIKTVNDEIITCNNQKKSCNEMLNNMNTQKQNLARIQSSLDILTNYVKNNNCSAYNPNSLSSIENEINKVNSDINRTNDQLRNLNRGSIWVRLRNLRKIIDLNRNTLPSYSAKLTRLNASKEIIQKCLATSNRMNAANIEKAATQNKINLLQTGYNSCNSNYNKKCRNKNDELLDLNENHADQVDKLDKKNTEYTVNCNERINCDELKRETDKNQAAYDTANAEMLNALQKYNDCNDPTKNNCKDIYNEMNNAKKKNTKLKLTEGYVEFDNNATPGETHRRIISNYESIEKDYNKLKHNTHELDYMNKNKTSETSKYAGNKQLYDKAVYTNILLTTLATSLLYYLIIEL